MGRQGGRRLTRVMITGAAGFLGQRLLHRLLEVRALGRRKIKAITLVDLRASPVPDGGDIELSVRQGDLADPEFLNAVKAERYDSLFHLAAQLTLQSETEPALAYRANVDALREMIDAARGCPKVIYASSIAIHGGDLPSVVDDSQNPTPTTTYGAHKAINELLIADYTRHGRIDGRSLRLPIVVTRPGSPTPAVSDQVAGILREPLNGGDITVPMTPETTVPIASAGVVVEAFLKLHDLQDDDLPAKRAFNLPALSVRVEEMVSAGKRRGARGTVRFAPDPQVQAIVDSWPKGFVSVTAQRLGIRPDADLDAVIDDYLAHRNG